MVSQGTLRKWREGEGASLAMLPDLRRGRYLRYRPAYPGAYPPRHLRRQIAFKLQLYHTASRKARPIVSHPLGKRGFEMSLFGTMKTAVSGMNAQANRLGTVGDNIANADTTAYKKASVQFSSLVLPSTPGAYTSGGVNSNVRYNVAEQGNLKFTSSTTDVAINGDGFFVVQNSAEVPYLTRAGSFVIDDSGNLVNAGGYTLLGYSFGSGAPAAVVNGFDGLEPINLSTNTLTASPSKYGSFAANLDARKPTVAAANLPSANAATADYSHKSSLVAYDSVGREVIYDFYYTKISDPVAGPPVVGAKWDISVFRKDKANPATGFPYSSVPAGNSITATFDPATGKIMGAPQSMSFTDNVSVPPQTITIDFSAMTQLAYDFTSNKATVDGTKAAAVKTVSIDKDGTLYAVYDDGSRDPRYRIALATVQSPDNLQLINGNVYSPSGDSGVVRTGFPGEGNFGQTISGALEDSNVDMASELTEMIQSQRSYTANSKVFQTGADLMDVLINLKR